MATKDKDGKLTYQMTSPGQAWNDFVNSKEGHNAASVTPAYLDSKKPNLYYESMAAKTSMAKDRSKQMDKDMEMDKDR